MKELVALITLIITFAGCTSRCFDCKRTKVCTVCNINSALVTVSCTAEDQPTISEGKFIPVGNYYGYMCEAIPNGIQEISYCERDGNEYYLEEFNCIGK